MKESGSDEAFDNLESSLKKLGNSRFEDFFAESYPEKWKSLNEEEKEIKIEELKKFTERPENKSRLHKIKDQLDLLKAIEFNVGFLFLGVLLGISGNLVANLVDRYFVKFGIIYDVSIIIIFSLSLLYIDSFFVKRMRKDIEKDQISDDLFAIVDNFKFDKTPGK